MPLSRNRKLNKNDKARKRMRQYRQTLHKGYVAFLNGAMDKDQWAAFKYFLKRRLLLGPKVARQVS